MIDTPLGGALVALAIGLLLGLERERSQHPDERLFAGIRTFPLLVLSGYLSGLASRQGLPLVLPALLLAVAALAVASYLRSAVVHAGATTEEAAVAIAAARLRQQGITTAGAAGGSYLLATLSNLLVKGGIAFLIGGRGLGRRAWPVFAVLAAATLVLLSW